MINDKLVIRRLEQDEFVQAIRKGLGRALLHVIHYGMDEVADLVLEACLHNQSHDPQCESSRASWLFRMFGHSTQYPRLGESILSKLKTETNPWNLLQLCGLAKEMAARGDKGARQRLGECVREKASIPLDDDWVGADLWVELEGIDGLLELARIYGQRLVLHPDDFVPDNLLSINETKQGFKEILFQHAQKESEIKAYWDYLEARGVLNPRSAPVDKEVARRRHHERVRQQHSVESILRDARNKLGQYPGRYTLFGRHATPDELKAIYTHLLKETDEAIQLRLLWIFRRAPLPELNEILFRWADGTDEALRQASIAALAQKADEQVHDLARSKVYAGKLVGADRGALDLFLNNYANGDAHLITQALVALNPNLEDAHSLGFSLAELAEQRRDVELANALKWVYENTPCTNCRYKVIKQLSSLQQFDEALLYECEFDAEEDIRTFAQKQREAA
jgi:hypothetical protein